MVHQAKFCSSAGSSAQSRYSFELANLSLLDSVQSSNWVILLSAVITSQFVATPIVASDFHDAIDFWRSCGSLASFSFSRSNLCIFWARLHAIHTGEGGASLSFLYGQVQVNEEESYFGVLRGSMDSTKGKKVNLSHCCTVDRTILLLALRWLRLFTQMKNAQIITTDAGRATARATS